MNNEEEQDRIVRQRLRVLRLAERLGNVSEACRRCGVSRTRFYEWKRRYDAEGPAGLRDRRQPGDAHPATIPDLLRQRILRLSLAQPSWGCNRLADHLNGTGDRVSSVTVQKVRNRHGLGTRRDRRRYLLDAKGRFGCRLSNEQLDFVHPRASRSLGRRSGSALFRFTGDVKAAIRTCLRALEKMFGAHPFARLGCWILHQHALTLLAVARSAGSERRRARERDTPKDPLPQQDFLSMRLHRGEASDED